MKTIYRISLFLNICLIGYLIVCASEYVTKKELLKESSDEVIKEEVNELLETSDVLDTLTCDTKMHIKCVDVETGEVSFEKSNIPMQIIGYDREMTSSYFDELNSHPGLGEQEKGFVRAVLTNFTPSEIEVTKYYHKSDLTKGFYLRSVDDYVYVYLSDLKTVYLETDIYMPDLPLDVQNQILDNKYFKDVTKLYNFLESYSS